MNSPVELQAMKVIPNRMADEVKEAARAEMQRELGQALMERVQPGKWYSIELRESIEPPPPGEPQDFVLRRATLTIVEDEPGAWGERQWLEAKRSG